MKDPVRKRRWYFRWWAWCLWTLLLIFAIIASWAWTQRYALMEDFVIETLAESGFESDLDIISVTKTNAVIRDIKLSQNGSPVVTLDELRADYVWPDVRDGRFLRVEVDNPDFTLRLDDQWRPSDPWLLDLLSEGNGGTENDGFPKNGISVKDGALRIQSPLGETTLYIDTDIPSSKSFEADVTLAPSDLAYGGYAANGAGVAEVRRDGQTFSIDGQVQTDVLSNGILSIRNAHIQLDGALNLDTLGYDGDITINGETIDSTAFAASAASLSWTGQIQPGETLAAQGTWDLSAKDAKIPNPVRVDQLSDTLSLYPALSVVPVTEHFAGSIKRVVRDYLVGTDLSARGSFNYDTSGFTLSPSAPVTLETAGNTLTLTPIQGQEFYVFDRAAQTTHARMDARFVEPVGLTLRDIDFHAGSPNGYLLAGVESVSAQVGTSQNWRATALSGEPVRLGPISTQVNYVAGQRRPRRLSLDTGLDYDGPLPGGVVEALALQGRLDVRLYEDRQQLDFTSRNETRITMKRLQTPTDWIAETVVFNLDRTENIFTRSPRGAELAATLLKPEFELTRPPKNTEPAQRVDLSADQMDLSGLLNPDKSQDWSIGFSEVDYSSETLPGPGTTARAPSAQVTANLTPDRPAQITLRSQTLSAATPLVEISNMVIEMDGTPDDYTVKHSGGFVTLVGSAAAAPAQAAGIATLPADGRVTFADGQFTGQANLRVAKAGNAPVDVAYTYANGIGIADIDVPSVKFDPKGLQPEDLIPAFRGKIARVTGEAGAQFHVEFADGALTTSNGNIDLVNMNIGTAPGPLTGVDTSIRLASLWPLQTSGTQTLTMKSFNPGLEMKDGVVTYQLVPEGVVVEDARWPLGLGRFRVDPFTWRYAAEENRVTLRVEDVALGDFLEDIGNSKLEATGTVVGVFPIVVRGVQVLVDGGEVSVPEGGVIKYDSGLPGRTYTQEEALAVFRQQRSNEYSAVAQDALKEFNYRSLSAAINGPLDGDVTVGLIFDGTNPKVLNSQPFRFDINVTGELINIARSFNSNAQVKSEVLKQTGLIAE